MGKTFERIKQGLNEAIGHAEGKQAGVKVWRPAVVDVAEVRGRLGFTQAQCAARFGGRWRVSGIGRLATATGSGPRWCCST